MSFEERLNKILEGAGHWKKWDGKEPIRIFVDPKSNAKYQKMTSKGRPPKKKKRLAGKL